MTDNTHDWQQADIAKMFLEHLRGGIPLAAEANDIILRVIRRGVSHVGRVLDLGCGDGILGRAILDAYPAADGVFLDFSEHMIAAAKQKADARRASFFVEDLRTPNWRRAVDDFAPFDLVISGLAIHHLTDARKKELYGEIFTLLKPGGLFLNYEYTTLQSEWASDAYHDLFFDSFTTYHQTHGGSLSRDAIIQQWKQRFNKNRDIPATVELQSEWLRQIGFIDVDCFFKVFALALFGGKRPQ